MTESEPERTERSTQELPEIPTVQEMVTWDKEEVLRWIQQKHSAILQGDDLETFNKAGIMGKAFLISDVEFYQLCGLPRGVGLVLKYLADKVKEGSKPSDQRAGRKRKGDDETVAPESSNKSPKRRRQEQQQEGEEGEEEREDDDDDEDVDDCIKTQDSIRLVDEPRLARKRRKRIEQMIKDLHKKHSDKHPDFPLSGAAAMLSDPEYEHLLPFPMVHMVTPPRFKLDEKYCWRYMGREKFAELLGELKFVRTSPNHESLWVYGTSGYGKSHLLAALVCYLAAEGERVIYLPSVRSCVGNPIRHLQTAMLFAWTDKATQDEIITLDTEEQIKRFLGGRGDFIFVIDQMNELTEAKNENKNARAKLKSLIQDLVLGHTAVFSTSANYQEYLERQISQNSFDRTMIVYGGFTPTETEQWWKRHSQVDLGGLCKKDIEDLTGRIPLYLNQCMVNGKIDLDPLASVGTKAATFTADTGKTTKEVGDSEYWNMYYDYVKACFTQSRVPRRTLEKPKLIDHRFFFHHKDLTGGLTCGIVRKAVADELLQNQQYFADSNFLKLLPKFIDNGPTTGFFVEYAVLFYLRLNGIPGHEYLGNNMEVINFDTDIPEIRKDIIGKPVVYHPTKYNYKTLDGIIVFIKEAEKQLLLYPYQVTLHRNTHKDSHTLFFKEYSSWVKELKEFEVETEFIWFTGDPDSYTAHLQSEPQHSRTRSGCTFDQSIDWPAHRESIISFDCLSKELGERYKEAKEAQREKKEHEAKEALMTKEAQKAKEAETAKKAEAKEAEEAKEAREAEKGKGSRRSKGGRGGRE